jgi:predicted nucleotidyltransferase
MSPVLTDAQAKVAEKVLHEEGGARRHLVVALSGAHAYGFPSPDSDLDLKAIHIEPTENLLGLLPAKPSASRLEVVDGIEIDYTSNELHMALLGILGGNGNFAERVLGEHLLVTSPDNEPLIAITRRALSKKLHRHYHGFATSQMKEVVEKDVVTAKKVLYVLRTTLTGAHVLLTGALVPNLAALADDYGFADAHRLIEAKTRGERTPLSMVELDHWRGALGRAFSTLDGARDRSVLPDEAPNRPEMEAWLLEMRRRFL